MPEQNDVDILRREIQRRLAVIDGRSCHHGVGYYATESTQDLARRHTAQRLAVTTEVKREQYLAAARVYRDGETVCSWCTQEVRDLSRVIAFGGKLLHKGPCQAQYEAFTSDVEVAL